MDLTQLNTLSRIRISTFNSKVVQSTGDFHDQIVILLLRTCSKSIKKYPLLEPHFANFPPTSRTESQSLNIFVLSGVCEDMEKILNRLLGIAEQIFDNSTPFDPNDNVFNDNTDFLNKGILLFLFCHQLFPFGFFLRLKSRYISWFMALKWM